MFSPWDGLGPSIAHPVFSFRPMSMTATCNGTDPNAVTPFCRWFTVASVSHSLGPRPPPRGQLGTSPLTELHRPRARRAVDVVGTPAYDPLRKSGGCAHTSGKASFSHDDRRRRPPY